MNMNKRSLTLIMATAALVLCLLSPFAGAVTIGYTADSGGESVSISENYDIDNTVTVKESTDISFGNLQVDQERTAEGTGEADLEQTITGKTADGTQYTAENVILSNGTVGAKTYTSATGNTLDVAQTVSATGNAALLLEGEEGGNLAGQYARVENGRLNSKQTLDIGNSVRASLYASIWGDFGAASAMAEDADDNWAWTWVEMENGTLSTKQEAEADGSATTGQESNVVDAEWGGASAMAEDADGNWAVTYVHMVNGTLSTVQEAEADGSATTGQESNVVDAEWGVAATWARDADNNRAETVVYMRKGELITIQGAEADGSAAAGQVSNVDAKWGVADTWARDADNNRAETVVRMQKGELITVQRAEADGSATAGQVSNVDAKWGSAGSVARDADNNWAKTVVRMQKGELITVQRAEADGSATAGQVSNVDAKRGSAVSVAEDADNNWAKTVVRMQKGELITVQGAEADGSAAAVQNSYIEGDFAWAICKARNADGRVYVDNYVVGNAVLDFEGVALATDDNVIAGQLSYAEGDFINPWTKAKNQYGKTFIENVVRDGTLYSASGAIANEDVAFSAQYMDATGTYIYRFVGAHNNNVVVPDDIDTIELDDGTVTREEISAAGVDVTSADVAVVP